MKIKTIFSKQNNMEIYGSLGSSNFRPIIFMPTTSSNMENNLKKFRKTKTPSEVNAYRCGSCDETEKLNLCPGCRLISYCSVKCQEAHSDLHEALCSATFKILALTGRQNIYYLRPDHPLWKILGAERLVSLTAQRYDKIKEWLGRDLISQEYNVSFSKFSGKLL